MKKSNWPHHISCGCQVCDMRRAEHRCPPLSLSEFLRVVTRARKAA